MVGKQLPKEVEKKGSNFAFKRPNLSKYLISTIAGMDRPIFEATYFEGLSEMLLHIQDPKGIGKVFDGFEVLMKTDDFNLQSSWRSLANLTASQRNYAIADPKPFTTYAVTVRGLLLPDTFSEMAEPVNLTRLNPGLFPPLHALCL